MEEEIDMNLFIDMNGTPTRIGDRVFTEKGIGVVNDITPTGVAVLLDSAEYPERFFHDGVRRLIQRVDTLETATELVRGLMEALTAAMEAEGNKESDTENERSLYYVRGKYWAYRRARSFAWHTLRNLERLEMAQDF